MVRELSKYICFSVILLAFVNCNSLVREEKIIGKYYLVATDNKDQLTIGYKVNGGFVGRVPPNVKYVKYNKKYIFVERYDIKKNAIFYYILDMSKDGEYNEPKDCIIGPESKFKCDSILNSIEGIITYVE